MPCNALDIAIICQREEGHLRSAELAAGDSRAAGIRRLCMLQYHRPALLVAGKSFHPLCLLP